jgi:molybdenum cofactor cytidylyltransferase
MVQPGDDIGIRTVGRPQAPGAGAIILAAGSGSRMGGRPKCLLERDGVPLLGLAIRALASAGIVDIVVVVGGDHEAAILAAMAAMADAGASPRDGGPRVGIARNDAPQHARAGSLHAGLRALPTGCDPVVVALADQPLIDGADVATLLQAYAGRRPGQSFLRPVVDGTPGNPIVFGRQVATDVLAAGGGMRGKDWEAQNAGAVLRLDSRNAHYVVDVDGPEDVERLGRAGIALRWPDGGADRTASPGAGEGSGPRPA